MRRVRDLLDALETLAPRSGCESWDNAGLLVGSGETALTSVAVALDADEVAVRKAAARGDGALVVHHPVIFTPLKAVTLDTPTGRTVAASLALGVSVVAAHTNWDRAPRGLNVRLGELLGLEGPKPLVPSLLSGVFGDGVVGDLPVPLSFADFDRLLRERWGLSWSHRYGQDGEVRRVAFVGGAGGSFRPRALEARADVFVTADLRYHERLDAVAVGMRLVQADHGEMEAASLPFLARELQSLLHIPVRLLS